MKTLFLSIGHNWGNGDQGAAANGTTEAAEVKKIIDAIIKQGIPGVNLIKVPEKLTLAQRVSWINKNLAGKIEPFAMEFHLDAAGVTARGASVWYAAQNTYTPNEGRQFLQKYTEVTGLTSRRVNPDSQNRLKRLWFVQDTKCASLLIELWFITNPEELSTIRTKAVTAIIESVKNMNAK